MRLFVFAKTELKQHIDPASVEASNEATGIAHIYGNKGTYTSKLYFIIMFACLARGAGDQTHNFWNGYRLRVLSLSRA